MKLTRKAKKIGGFSLGSVLVVALLVWYFYPVLVYKWIWCHDDSFRKLLEITPVTITVLKEPPKEWENICVGDLSIKLPMSEYSKVGGKDYYIYFSSSKGVLAINDIVPPKEVMETLEQNHLPYPTVSYRDKLAYFSSVPTDISFFHSRKRNLAASTNQVLKGIAMPLGGPGSKLLNINTGALKALCILSGKGDRGYRAFVDVYSGNERVFVSLMFNGYKDKAMLEADVLAVLGGLRMPDHMNNSDQVRKDINRVVKQYSKT